MFMIRLSSHSGVNLHAQLKDDVMHDDGGRSAMRVRVRELCHRRHVATQSESMLKPVDLIGEPRRGAATRAEAGVVRSESRRGVSSDQLQIIFAATEKNGEEPLDKEKCTEPLLIKDGEKEKEVNDALGKVEAAEKAKTDRADARMPPWSVNESLAPHQHDIVVASVVEAGPPVAIGRQLNAKENYAIRSAVALGLRLAEPTRQTDGSASMPNVTTCEDNPAPKTVETYLKSTSAYFDKIAPKPREGVNVGIAGDNGRIAPDAAVRPCARRQLKPRYGSASRCMQRLLGPAFDVPASTPLPERSYLEQDFEAKFISFWPASEPAPTAAPNNAERDGTVTEGRTHRTGSTAASVSSSRKSVRFNESDHVVTAESTLLDKGSDAKEKNIGDSYAYIEHDAKPTYDDGVGYIPAAVSAPQRRSGDAAWRKQLSGRRRTSDLSIGTDTAQDEAAAHAREVTPASSSRSNNIVMVKSISSQKRRGGSASGKKVPEQGAASAAFGSQSNDIILGKSISRGQKLDVSRGADPSKEVAATSVSRRHSIDVIMGKSVSRDQRSDGDIVRGTMSPSVSVSSRRSSCTSPDIDPTCQDSAVLFRIPSSGSRRRSTDAIPLSSVSSRHTQDMDQTAAEYSKDVPAQPLSRRHSNTIAPARQASRRTSSVSSDIGSIPVEDARHFQSAVPWSCSPSVVLTNSASGSSRRSSHANCTQEKDNTHVRGTRSIYSSHSNDVIPAKSVSCRRTPHASLDGDTASKDGDEHFRSVSSAVRGRYIDAVPAKTPSDRRAASETPNVDLTPDENSNSSDSDSSSSCSSSDDEPEVERPPARALSGGVRSRVSHLGGSLLELAAISSDARLRATVSMPEVLKSGIHQTSQ